MGYSEARRCRFSSIFRTETLVRVAAEADTAKPIDLLERERRTPIPSRPRLLLSAADVLEGNEALDSLFQAAN